MALTDEVQKVGGSTKQELYDRKIYWWFEDEKDLKDDLEWQEKKSELNENGLQWQVSGDMLGDLSWVFYMWEKELYTEFFHYYIEPMKRFKYRSDKVKLGEF